MASLTRKIDAAVEGTISLGGLNDDRPHTQVALRFEDSAGQSITPGAGTFTISIRPVGQGSFQSIQRGENIDATASLDALTYSAIGKQLKYSPTGVTGAEFIWVTLISTRA